MNKGDFMGVHGWNQFLLSTSENIPLVIFINIMSISVYYLFFSRQVHSLFDPLFLSVLSSALATATCICSYIFGIFINEDLIWSFAFSEIAYVLGMNFYKKVDLNLQEKFYFPKKDFFYVTLILFSAIYILFSIVSIFFIGLPLFSLADTSRLEMYAGGFGIVPIVLKATTPVLMFLLLNVFFCSKNFYSQTYCCFMFALIIVNLIGSGAKSSSLKLMYILFFYQLYLKKDVLLNGMIIAKLNKWVRWFFVISIIGCFIVLGVEISNTSLYELMLNLGMRLLGYGDIFSYFYGDIFYPHNIIINDNVFLAIFGPALQFFRMFNYTGDLASEIGLQVWQFANTSIDVRGPNTRHNILGLVYLGQYGCVIFSFFIGVICSFIRNKLFIKCRRNFYVFPLFYIIYSGACDFATDIAVAIGDIISQLTINVFLLFGSYVLYLFIYDTRKKMKSSD